MQTKGKGSKVLVAIYKDRSRLLTFPRGDSPPLKVVYVTSPVREKGFMAVFVLDKRGKPLMQCSEKRARLLLDRGRARIHKMLPFTIRVVDRLVEDSQLQPLEIKLDPGSKTTGVAVVRISVAVDAQTGEVQKRVHVLNLFELIHRSRQITEAIMGRRGHRRLRRSKLRYRAPRFDNRGNQKKGVVAS